MTPDRSGMFEWLGRRSKLWSLVPLLLIGLLMAAKLQARSLGGTFMAEPFGVLAAILCGAVSLLMLISQSAVWVRDQLVPRAVMQNVYRHHRQPWPNQPVATNPRIRAVPPQPTPTVYGTAARPGAGTRDFDTEVMDAIGFNKQYEIGDEPTGSVT